MTLPTAHVDGHSVPLTPGQTWLEVLEGRGVPTLCHDPRLIPRGSCGVCVVEVRPHEDQAWALVPACATPAQPGWAVRTQSDAIETARRRTVELLFTHHDRAARFRPERLGTDRPALVCACRGHPTCSLRALCLDLAADPDRHGERADPEPEVSLRPGIELEMAKCVRCERCVRICSEVAEVGALGFAGRGRETTLVFALLEGSEAAARCDRCEAGGALCIDTCPTDALHPPRGRGKRDG